MKIVMHSNNWDIPQWMTAGTKQGSRKGENHRHMSDNSQCFKTKVNHANQGTQLSSPTLPTCDRNYFIDVVDDNRKYALQSVSSMNHGVSHVTVSQQQSYGSNCSRNSYNFSKSDDNKSNAFSLLNNFSDIDFNITADTTHFKRTTEECSTSIVQHPEVRKVTSKGETVTKISEKTIVKHIREEVQYNNPVQQNHPNTALSGNINAISQKQQSISQEELQILLDKASPSSNNTHFVSSGYNIQKQSKSRQQSLQQQITVDKEVIDDKCLTELDRQGNTPCSFKELARKTYKLSMGPASAVDHLPSLFENEDIKLNSSFLNTETTPSLSMLQTFQPTLKSQVLSQQPQQPRTVSENPKTHSLVSIDSVSASSNSSYTITTNQINSHINSVASQHAYFSKNLTSQAATSNSNNRQLSLENEPFRKDSERSDQDLLKLVIEQNKDGSTVVYDSLVLLQNYVRQQNYTPETIQHMLEEEEHNSQDEQKQYLDLYLLRSLQLAIETPVLQSQNQSLVDPLEGSIQWDSVFKKLKSFIDKCVVDVLALKKLQRTRDCISTPDTESNITVNYLQPNNHSLSIKSSSSQGYVNAPTHFLPIHQTDFKMDAFQSKSRRESTGSGSVQFHHSLQKSVDIGNFHLNHNTNQSWNIDFGSKKNSGRNITQISPDSLTHIINPQQGLITHSNRLTEENGLNSNLCSQQPQLSVGSESTQSNQERPWLTGQKQDQLLQHHTRQNQQGLQLYQQQQHKQGHQHSSHQQQKQQQQKKQHHQEQQLRHTEKKCQSPSQTTPQLLQQQQLQYGEQNPPSQHIQQQHHQRQKLQQQQEPQERLPQQQQQPHQKHESKFQDQHPQLQNQNSLQHSHQQDSQQQGQHGKQQNYNQQPLDQQHQHPLKQQKEPQELQHSSKPQHMQQPQQPHHQLHQQSQRQQLFLKQLHPPKKIQQQMQQHQHQQLPVYHHHQPKLDISNNQGNIVKEQHSGQFGQSLIQKHSYQPNQGTEAKKNPNGSRNRKEKLSDSCPSSIQVSETSNSFAFQKVVSKGNSTLSCKLVKGESENSAFQLEGLAATQNLVNNINFMQSNSEKSEVSDQKTRLSSDLHSKVEKPRTVVSSCDKITNKNIFDNNCCFQKNDSSVDSNDTNPPISITSFPGHPNSEFSTDNGRYSQSSTLLPTSLPLPLLASHCNLSSPLASKVKQVPTMMSVVKESKPRAKPSKRGPRKSSKRPLCSSPGPSLPIPTVSEAYSSFMQGTLQKLAANSSKLSVPNVTKSSNGSPPRAIPHHSVPLAIVASNSGILAPSSAIVAASNPVVLPSNVALPSQMNNSNLMSLLKSPSKSRGIVLYPTTPEKCKSAIIINSNSPQAKTMLTSVIPSSGSPQSGKHLSPVQNQKVDVNHKNLNISVWSHDVQKRNSYLPSTASVVPETCASASHTRHGGTVEVSYVKEEVNPPSIYSRNIPLHGPPLVPYGDTSGESSQDEGQPENEEKGGLNETVNEYVVYKMREGQGKSMGGNEDILWNLKEHRSEVQFVDLNRKTSAVDAIVTPLASSKISDGLQISAMPKKTAFSLIDRCPRVSASPNDRIPEITPRNKGVPKSLHDGFHLALHINNLGKKDNTSKNLMKKKIHNYSVKDGTNPVVNDTSTVQCRTSGFVTYVTSSSVAMASSAPIAAKRVAFGDSCISDKFGYVLRLIELGDSDGDSDDPLPPGFVSKVIQVTEDETDMSASYGCVSRVIECNDSDIFKDKQDEIDGFSQEKELVTSQPLIIPTKMSFSASPGKNIRCSDNNKPVLTRLLTSFMPTATVISTNSVRLPCSSLVRPKSQPQCIPFSVTSPYMPPLSRAPSPLSGLALASPTIQPVPPVVDALKQSGELPLIRASTLTTAKVESLLNYATSCDNSVVPTTISASLKNVSKGIRRSSRASATKTQLKIMGCQEFDDDEEDPETENSESDDDYHPYRGMVPSLSPTPGADVDSKPYSTLQYLTTSSLTLSLKAENPKPLVGTIVSLLPEKLSDKKQCNDSSPVISSLLETACDNKSVSGTAPFLSPCPKVSVSLPSPAQGTSLSIERSLPIVASLLAEAPPPAVKSEFMGTPMPIESTVTNLSDKLSLQNVKLPHSVVNMPILPNQVATCNKNIHPTSAPMPSFPCSTTTASTQQAVRPLSPEDFQVEKLSTSCISTEHCPVVPSPIKIPGPIFSLPVSSSHPSQSSQKILLPASLSSKNVLKSQPQTVHDIVSRFKVECGDKYAGNQLIVREDGRACIKLLKYLNPPTPATQMKTEYMSVKGERKDKKGIEQYKTSPLKVVLNDCNKSMNSSASKKRFVGSQLMEQSSSNSKKSRYENEISSVKRKLKLESTSNVVSKKKTKGQKKIFKLQTKPCGEFAELPKCLDCKSDDVGEAYCRFNMFRKLDVSDPRRTLVTGFSEPNSASEKDLPHWTYQNKINLDLDLSEHILKDISVQFQQLVLQELDAKGWTGSEDPVWKQAVLRVREMCDICSTTVFNMHWTCPLCGLSVCLDCYRSALDYDKSEKNIPYSWPNCDTGRHHTEQLIVTQIIPKNILVDLLRDLLYVAKKINLKFRRLDMLEYDGSIGIEQNINRSFPELGDSKLISDEDLFDDPVYDNPEPTDEGLPPYCRKFCNGRMVHIENPNFTDESEIMELFKREFRNGVPVIVSHVRDRLKKDLWTPQSLSKEFGDELYDIVNCYDGSTIPDFRIGHFWDGFENVSVRPIFNDEPVTLLKLKDWPPKENFSKKLPYRFADIMQALPAPSYTRRNGDLNLAARLPKFFAVPDLGPKMYNAYGSASYPRAGTTNLHLDISDATNVIAYVGIPHDEVYGKKETEDTFAVVDRACCEETRSRIREPGVKPGALWHIFPAHSARKIRRFLRRVADERGMVLSERSDPIHDQSFYLDLDLLKKLKAEEGVEGYAICQCEGDAVFIPAGAPHQVLNLHSCIKVAEDFVAPDHITHCFQLTQEFRYLSDHHTNHEDKLQIKNILFHAVKDCLGVLKKHHKL